MTTPTTGKGRDTARARLADPFTSHIAAAVATRRLPTVRETVHRLLVDAGGPLTHDQIIAAYQRAVMNGTAKRATDSSIRSRVNELEKDEVVVVVPDTVARSRYGNPARLHAARAVYDHETNRAQEVAP